MVVKNTSSYVFKICQTLVSTVCNYQLRILIITLYVYSCKAYAAMLVVWPGNLVFVKILIFNLSSLYCCQKYLISSCDCHLMHSFETKISWVNLGKSKDNVTDYFGKFCIIFIGNCQLWPHWSWKRRTKAETTYLSSFHSTYDGTYSTYIRGFGIFQTSRYCEGYSFWSIWGPWI